MAKPKTNVVRADHLALQAQPTMGMAYVSLVWTVNGVQYEAFIALDHTGQHVLIDQLAQVHDECRRLDDKASPEARTVRGQVLS